MYTREQIQEAVISKGYKWFTGGSLDKDYDVNIVGIRNSGTGDKVTNKFDDHITVSYKINGVWQPVKVYRDKNKDGNYDLIEENVHEGLYGINIHRATKYAGKKSTQIDRWSAGCQVIAANDDWTAFMKIMRKARNIWGNSFTYTLIESKDIK